MPGESFARDKRVWSRRALAAGVYLLAGWSSAVYGQVTQDGGAPPPGPEGAAPAESAVVPIAAPSAPPVPPAPDPPEPEALDPGGDLAAAVEASERARDHAIEIAVGWGISSALGRDSAGRDLEGSGSGGYGQGEYVYRRVPWATPRAYAGLLMTFPEGDCGPDVAPCDVSAKIGFLGVKVRLMAPIPYFGPFIELGIGGTVGSLTTRVGGTVNVSHAGVTYHVPVTLGIAFGRRHQYTFALHFLAHPEQEQAGGGFAVGIGFPVP